MAVGLLLFLILLIGLIVWNQKNRVEHTTVRQSQERQKQETVQKTEQTAEDSKETEEKAREREEDSRTTEEPVQEAVSYTHLDVYKRQNLHMRRC